MTKPHGHDVRILFVGVTQRENTSAFGGAPVVVVNLANELTARGIDVAVLVFTRRGVTEFPFPFDPRVDLYSLRARTKAGLFLSILWHLLRIRPHVMAAVGTKANRLCSWATRVPGVRTRFWASLHHALSSETAGWSAHKRRRRIRLWHRILDRAQGLICVSQGVAVDLRTLTRARGDKILVVYNPIVGPDLAARCQAHPDHPWLSDGGPPVILGVGRLTEQKDFSTLIAAYALVRGQRPCRLLIVGEGEERERLLALATKFGVQDGLDLAGFHPNPLPIMRAARMLVMSSRWEGFGNVLVEALYCGTAVVSTDCPHGPREVLADGAFGRLVPVGDARALAHAIAETLVETPDRQRLCSRAEEFSVARSADGYLEAMGFSVRADGMNGQESREVG